MGLFERVEIQVDKAWASWLLHNSSSEVRLASQREHAFQLVPCSDEAKHMVQLDAVSEWLEVGLLFLKKLRNEELLRKRES